MSSWYAALNGTPTGDGTKERPWDFVTAWCDKSSVILPGDTLYMRHGKYISPGAWWDKTFTGAKMPRLLGTPAAPIIVRPYPGETVSIDLLSFLDSLSFDNAARSGNTLGWSCHDTQFWSIEFFSSTIQRSSNQSGNNGMPNQLMFRGDGLKLIHCYVHDIGNLIATQEAKDFEAYGNIVLDIGWNGPDRGHGHNFYIENDNTNGSRKTYDNNFAGASFDIAVQIFGTSAKTKDVSFERNAVWDGGAHVGIAGIQLMAGQNRPTGLRANKNIFYVSPRLGSGFVQFGWPWDSQNGTAEVTENLISGPSFEVRNWDMAVVRRNEVYSRNPNGVVMYTTYPKSSPPQSLAAWDLDDNTYGPGIRKAGISDLDNNGNNVLNVTGIADIAAWKSTVGGDAASVFDAVPKLTVRAFPSRYIPSRIHITVFNPEALPNVTVSLAGAGIPDGALYELRDAQNFNGAPVQLGTITGQSVSVPATGLTRKPLLGSGFSVQAQHTAPHFLTFILLTGPSLDGTWVARPGDPLPPPSPLPEPPPPPIGGPMNINSFTASVTSIPNGGSVVLSWNVTGPGGLVLRGPITAALPLGQQLGSQPLIKTTSPLVPPVTDGIAEYKLTTDDQKSVTVTVAVGNAVPPPPPVNVVWSIESGNPPPGLTISLSGLLFGVPTTVGAYTFVVKAVDGAKIGRRTVTMNITAAQVGESLSIDPEALPVGTVGKAFTFQFKVV